MVEGIEFLKLCGDICWEFELFEWIYLLRILMSIYYWNYNFG
jgi:hypothetical protein